MVTFRQLGRHGRFGNQLFQYAAVFLYCRRFGYRMAMPDWLGTRLFENVRPWRRTDALLAAFLPTRQLEDMQSWNRWGRIKYILGIWKHLPETCRIEELHAHPRDNIDMRGYLQDRFSLDLLRRHKREVLSHLAFRPDLDARLRQATCAHGAWTAVHVRRGDMVQLGGAIPVEQYAGVLRDVHRDGPLYVASDDPKVVEGFAAWRPMVISPESVGVDAVLLDFWMLARAAVVIGGGSTFSWWAAYLGNANQYYSLPLTHLWGRDGSLSFARIEV